MSETACMYAGNREETLVAYLYDDIATADRRAFEAHLASCEVCRGELSEFGIVRARLAAWAPPEPTRALAPSSLPSVSARRGVLAALHEVPVWMQAVAAMLFLGLSAGAANLDINYTADGFSVRTGWLSPSATDAAQSLSQTPISAAVPSVNAVSRDELSALMRLLREEIGGARAADADLARKVRTLIAESERKQENELALRSAAVLHDVQSQREGDLLKIERGLAVIRAVTDREIRRQQQRTDTIQARTDSITTQLTRVSQKQ